MCRPTDLLSVGGKHHSWHLPSLMGRTAAAAPRCELSAHIDARYHRLRHEIANKRTLRFVYVPTGGDNARLFSVRSTALMPLSRPTRPRAGYTPLLIPFYLRHPSPHNPAGKGAGGCRAELGRKRFRLGRAVAARWLAGWLGAGGCLAVPGCLAPKTRPREGSGQAAGGPETQGRPARRFGPLLQRLGRVVDRPAWSYVLWIMGQSKPERLTANAFAFRGANATAASYFSKSRFTQTPSPRVTK